MRRCLVGANKEMRIMANDQQDSNDSGKDTGTTQPDQQGAQEGTQSTSRERIEVEESDFDYVRKGGGDKLETK